MDVSADRTMVTAVQEVLTQVGKNLVTGPSLKARRGSLEKNDFRAAAFNVLAATLLEWVDRGEDFAIPDLADLGIEHENPRPFRSGGRKGGRPAPLAHVSSIAAVLNTTICVHALVDWMQEELPDSTALERVQAALATIADRLGVTAPDLSDPQQSQAKEDPDGADELDAALRAFAILDDREADLSDGTDFDAVRSLLPVLDEERLVEELQVRAIEQTLLELERAGEVESVIGDDGVRAWRRAEKLPP